jgi:hypothetical protein
MLQPNFAKFSENKDKIKDHLEHVSQKKTQILPFDQVISEKNGIQLETLERSNEIM